MSPEWLRRLCWVGLSISALSCSDPSPGQAVVRTADDWQPVLLACPGDQVWETAIRELGRAGELGRLAEVAGQAAAVCSGWEPLWAAGEILYKQDPKAPREPFERMAASWNAAAAIAEAAAQPAGVSRATNRLATYFRVTGDFSAAEQSARRALAAATTAERDDLQAYAHNTLAGIFRGQARFEEALDALARAAELFKQTGNEETAITLGYNQSILLEDLGQLAREKRLLEQVHADATRMGIPRYAERAAVAMGNLHLLYRELDEARSWFERVPVDSTQMQNVALGLGRIALREGRFHDAIRHLDVAAGAPDPAFSLWSRRVRAQAELLNGDAQGAATTLAAVIEESRAMGASDTEALAQALLGKCYVRMGRPQAALDPVRRAVELIDGSGEGLGPADGMTFLRERYEPYVELAALLVEGDRPADEVLRVIESAHARALRQILGGGEAPAIEVPTVAALQQQLVPGELLLDYLIGDDRGVVIALTRSNVRMKVLPGWETLRTAITRYRRALIRPLTSAEARAAPMADLRRDLATGARLRAWLFGGVEDLVAAASRLYVVPDQDLALLPFAALPEEDGPDGSIRFLGETLEVGTLPLASPPDRSAGGRGPFLLAGDPVGNASAASPDGSPNRGDFPELPLAAAELDAIAEVWQGESTTRLDRARWTSQGFRSLPLDSFGTLHLATHAVASSRDPDRCAVILSGGDRLGVRELAAMNLGPGLVVLSACRTGGGEIVPGEGVVGLTWAFLQAGALQVVASLWTVEDAATKDLMVEFHIGLRGGADPVSALHRAQSVARASQPHPAYWSPFVVMLAPASD